MARKPILSDSDSATLVRLYESGTRVDELLKRFPKVKKATVYNVIKRQQANSYRVRSLGTKADTTLLTVRKPRSKAELLEENALLREMVAELQLRLRKLGA